MPNLRAMPMQVVVVDFPANSLSEEFVAILRGRGLTVEERELASTPGKAGIIAAHALGAVPSAPEAAALGELLARHASAGRPPILYVPAGGGKSTRADERAGGIALLRARGAIVTSDPEVWVECVVLLAAYGPPSGTKVAIVAPPASWLAAAAAAQQLRAEQLGERFRPVTREASQLGATDIVLADTATLRDTNRETRHLVVPVAGRPQQCRDRPALVGLASALAAVELAGRAKLRIAAGDGPAPTPYPGDGIDASRLRRQLDKLNQRAGDHECKVLLSSVGVRITRQAVATTPSAATRVAKKAGYPVEIKAWIEEQPSELEGCLVLRDLNTAADVRRAFASVCARTDCEAVIVRETPETGREVRVHIREHGALGLMVLLHQRGQREPAAALAPLRQVDAEAMARHVVASRSSDQDPDWAALADTLVRASHLVADNRRVLSLELSRVVIGETGKGVTVIDARATLAPR